MKCDVNFNQLTPIEQIAGENEAETEALRGMLGRAEAYIRSFRWCPPITERYLGFGIGDVIALFLFQLDRPVGGTDECLWVVEGDLPSAYFVVDAARDVASALAVYCDLMEQWANAVVSGAALSDVFPVNAPATTENAQLLLRRVKFIRDQVLPAV